MDQLKTLESKAIKASQEQQWEQALDFNSQILETDPKNISAMNRLAICYAQIGKCDKAKELYTKVLEIDQFNPIAKKNLASLQKSKQCLAFNIGSLCQQFIEEPGKTKTIQLCRVAEPAILSVIPVGTTCALKPKQHRIAVETESGKYIGSLPDDLSHHLSKIVQDGAEYSVVVQSINKQECAVFVKEISKPKKWMHTCSFPITNYRQSVPETDEELLIGPHEYEIEIPETGEEEHHNLGRDSYEDQSDRDFV